MNSPGFIFDWNSNKSMDSTTYSGGLDFPKILDSITVAQASISFTTNEQSIYLNRRRDSPISTIPREKVRNVSKLPKPTNSQAGHSSRRHRQSGTVSPGHSLRWPQSKPFQRLQGCALPIISVRGHAHLSRRRMGAKHNAFTRG